MESYSFLGLPVVGWIFTIISTLVACLIAMFQRFDSNVKEKANAGNKRAIEEIFNVFTMQSTFMSVEKIDGLKKHIFLQHCRYEKYMISNNDLVNAIHYKLATSYLITSRARGKLEKCISEIKKNIDGNKGIRDATIYKNYAQSRLVRIAMIVMFIISGGSAFYNLDASGIISVDQLPSCPVSYEEAKSLCDWVKQ